MSDWEKRAGAAKAEYEAAMRGPKSESAKKKLPCYANIAALIKEARADGRTYAAIGRAFGWSAQNVRIWERAWRMRQRRAVKAIKEAPPTADELLEELLDGLAAAAIESLKKEPPNVWGSADAMKRALRDVFKLAAANGLQMTLKFEPKP